MSDEQSPFVDVYDTITGNKLPNQVPRHWLDHNFFPNLSLTPAAKAAETSADEAAKTTLKKEAK